MARLSMLLLLLLLASAASAETIWLRGRGNDVWIEKDGRYQAPQPDHKGFTRVTHSSRHVLYRDRPQTEPVPRSSSDGVVLGPGRWPRHSYPHHVYYPDHEGYTYYPQPDHEGYTYYPQPDPYGYTHYPSRHYRDHYPRRHYRQHDGRSHEGVGHEGRHGSRGDGRSSLRQSGRVSGVVQRGGGHVERGGAYRRVR